MNKISETYQSPRWTGEIADCSLPVTFDTYSNCSFGCVYCFSQYQRGIGASKEAYLNKDTSGEEHLRQMKSVEEELENTTSEHRKRDLRKRLQRLKKQLNQYDCYRGY